MKTKMIKISLALAVIAAAGYTAYSSQTEVQLNGVALENVEALASGETTTGGKVRCAEGDYNPFGTFELLCDCRSWKSIKVTGHGTCSY